MAVIIPNLRLSHAKVTPGERRFAVRLEHLLEDDYWCFYDIPVGWRLRSIQSIDHQKVDLQTAAGLQSRANPVEQARQGAYQTVDMLRCCSVSRILRKVCQGIWRDFGLVGFRS